MLFYSGFQDAHGLGPQPKSQPMSILEFQGSRIQDRDARILASRIPRA